MSDEAGGAAQTTYARKVGVRLRAIRRQQGLSLQEVESLSGQEFKASVLGAYERGERVISVPRLQRPAGLYHVPVDQLLPSAPPPYEGRDPAWGANGEGAAGTAADGITFDLSRLAHVDDPELAMVQRYLHHIALLRQDFNGRMLTIRGDDVRAMAGMFGTDLNDLIRRLDNHQLRITRESLHS